MVLKLVKGDKIPDKNSQEYKSDFLVEKLKEDMVKLTKLHLELKSLIDELERVVE